MNSPITTRRRFQCYQDHLIPRSRHITRCCCRPSRLRRVAQRPSAGRFTQKIQFEHHSWSLAHREKSGIVESHGTRTSLWSSRAARRPWLSGRMSWMPRTLPGRNSRHLHPRRNRTEGVSRRYHQYARRAAPSVPSRTRKANYLHRHRGEHTLKSARSIAGLSLTLISNGTLAETTI